MPGFMWEVGIQPRVAFMLGKHSSNLATSLAETIYAFKLFYPDVDLPTNYKIWNVLTPENQLRFQKPFCLLILLRTLTSGMKISIFWFAK